MARKRKPAALATGSSIAIAEGSDLRFGGNVTFDTVAEGLVAQEYPMVYVACHRADGEWLYGALRHPDAVFTLGGDANQGPWFEDQTAADCVATLYAYGGATPGQDVRPLASVSFHAEG